MNRTYRMLGLLLSAWVAAPALVLGQAPEEAAVPPSSVEARVWVDRGEDPVLRRGDRVRVYYRTSADAFVSIFHIDTNGGVRLLYPSSPEVDPYVAGERDYRLLFPRSSQWYVDEDPGIGYYFIVASPDPLDFRDFRYSYTTGGWDLSFAGRTVYEDPFVAMDEYIARLIPDWETADYALDYLEYHVGDRHEYPRFLCYDCHGFSPYSTWNPYLSACSSFSVVAFNDPWYYPINRYRGGWVVWARPPIWGQPRYVFRDRRPGDPWGPIVEPRPSVGDRPGIPGDAVQRRSGAGIGSGGRAPLPGRPGSPGTLQRRTRPSTSPLNRDPRNGSRPVLERRTGSRPGSGSGSGSDRGGIRRPDPTGRGSAEGPTRSTPRGTGVEVIRGRPGTGSVAPPSSREGSGAVRRPSRGAIPGTVRVPTPTGRERPTAVRSGGTSRASPGTGTRATPGRSGSRGGTVIRRAPTSRSSGGVAPPTRTRPSGAARPPTSRSGIGSAPAAPRSRSGGGVRRAPRRTGGSSVRAPARSSGGVVRSAPRSRGGGVSRTPVRRRPGGSVRSTPPRSRPGGAVRSRPKGARPGGSVRSAPNRRSGAVRRTPAKPGGRGGAVRPRPPGGGFLL